MDNSFNEWKLGNTCNNLIKFRKEKNTVLPIIFFFAAHYYPGIWGIWDFEWTLDIFKSIV